MSQENPPLNRKSFVLSLMLLAILIAPLFLFKRFFFVPKILIVGLIILAASLLGKIKLLIKDWFVFIAFIYLFDSLRGSIYILTCKFQLPVHALYVLNIEKALFGTVPSVTLQKLLLRPDLLGNFTWLEKTLTVFYGSHFIAFLFLGFFIWLNKTKSFSLYKSSFYLLVSTGILGYALVPTVPPWMASSQFGLLPPITHFNTILLNFSLPDISRGFDVNPIAAMPSLHAAFPILCSLLLWGFYRWRAFLFYIYTLVILFTIVYTGDHYITDILAGLILVAISYVLALRSQKRRSTSWAGKPVLQTQPTIDAASLKKPLLAGLGIFLIGIIIGSINKTQFMQRADIYDSVVPRYADFFSIPDRYKDNYLVQSYLGNHYFSRKEYQTALLHFERSLALARNYAEKKKTQRDIGFCRRMLGKIG